MHRMLLEVLGHKEGSQAEDALVRRLTEAGGGSGGPRVIQTARLVWGGSEGQCTRRWGVTTAVREVARHAREEDFLWQGRGGRREVPPHPWGLHSLSPTSSLASSLASSSCRPPSRPGRGCARQQVLCDSRNSTTCSNMDRRNLGLGWGGAGHCTTSCARNSLGTSHAVCECALTCSWRGSPSRPGHSEAGAHHK